MRQLLGMRIAWSSHFTDSFFETLLPSIVITSNSFVVSSLGAHTPAKTCGAGLEENPDPNGDV